MSEENVCNPSSRTNPGIKRVEPFRDLISSTWHWLTSPDGQQEIWQWLTPDTWISSTRKTMCCVQAWNMEWRYHSTAVPALLPDHRLPREPVMASCGHQVPSVCDLIDVSFRGTRQTGGENRFVVYSGSYCAVCANAAQNDSEFIKTNRERNEWLHGCIQHTLPVCGQVYDNIRAQALKDAADICMELSALKSNRTGIRAAQMCANAILEISTLK